MNTKRSRRKVKNVINYLRRTAGYGKYVVDCRFHPCIVIDTNNDLYGNSIDVESLFNGKTYSCSLMHCGILPISKAEAYERADFLKCHSFNDYLSKYEGYSQEDYNKINELDKDWNFDKGT